MKQANICIHCLFTITAVFSPIYKAGVFGCLWTMQDEYIHQRTNDVQTARNTRDGNNEVGIANCKGTSLFIQYIMHTQGFVTFWAESTCSRKNYLLHIIRV